MNLENVILRDTRANQPVATTVPSGTLYYVTDESVLERSNGTTWQSYSSSAGAPDTLTFVTGNDETSDLPNSLQILAGTNVTFDVSTPNELTVNAAGGSSDWDFSISKSTDQDVTNSTTLVNDTELTHTVANGDVWLLEFDIIWGSSDATGAYKFALAFPTAQGVLTVIYPSASSVATNSPIRVGAATSISSINCIGHAGLTSLDTLRFQIVLAFFGAGAVVFQFANATASSGRVSRTFAGSLFRGKQLK